MAKKIYGPVNGARKEVTAIYGPVNGARKEVYKVYGSVNGARKLVWEKQATNLYGILTYYGVTIAPAGTITEENGTTPALSATLLQSISDFENVIQEQWVSEGHQEQIDFTYPIKIDVYHPNQTMVSGEQLDANASTYVEVMTTDGYYSEMWIWYTYSDISSYVDIRATESGQYDGNYAFEVLTQPTEVVDKTTQASFALTSLSMYNTGYNSSSGFNIGSETIPPERIKAFKFGDSVTSVPNNFLAYSALEAIDLGNSNITTIGNSFLTYCTNFTHTGTLDLSAVTSIGNDFLHSCTSFNSPIVLGEGLTSISSFFLSNCASFNQPLTLPSSVTSIGNNFLYECSSFNQPLTLPSGVTSIGNYFMYYCLSFNQSLTLPSGVTKISSEFMRSCTSFNQPLTLPSSATSIGSGFMHSCTSFNQSLTLPSGLTSIGTYFMYSCTSFNQPLALPSSVASIGNYFMYSCNSFNQPFTIPSGITTIGTYFLAYCRALNSPITLNCPSLTSIGKYFMTSLRDFTSYVSVTTSAAAPTDNYAFSATGTSAQAYTTGVQICGSWEGRISDRTSYPYRKIVPCSL